ncbi:DUF4181 domain-containing protein [Halalkalibacter krulwichiae]|uniref:DUF4181 domain-containing protein n=1 Tax=Halalkalibacter krulwichiae TaxID=199441 RepID=A0A1X9MAD6_9BACI|nr:DUF4181 domain-containing protein [Halalkalibacter krulwichiae]ARK29614.1 hypothetical protein BkAM31D_06925 [Halalkalibacter krulwichiae]
MGYILIVSIFVLAVSTHLWVRGKLQTAKRGWYKHQHKVFHAIFYALLSLFLITSLLLEVIGFLLAFSLLGAFTNLLFGFEKWKYEKQKKQYVHYLLDSFFWLLISITIYLFI